MTAQKTALITGASRGIGAAIFKALGESGAYVIGAASGEKGVNAIAESIRQNKISGEAKIMDARSPSQIDEVAAEIESSHGGADILINNAGITRDNLLVRLSDDDWRDLLAVNLDAAFYLSRRLVRGMMKRRWGRIISVSSVVAAMGGAGQVNYCASKAGLEGFTRALAREVGARGITVNAVAPGFIDTDMTRAILIGERRDSLLKNIPLGRVGEAEEIAQAVAFLASDSAAYITGQTLHINGGLYMGG